MGTATRMTRARAAAKTAFTEPPSTAPPSQLAVPLSPDQRKVRLYPPCARRPPAARLPLRQGLSRINPNTLAKGLTGGRGALAGGRHIFMSLLVHSGIRSGGLFKSWYKSGVKVGVERMLV